MQRLLIQNYRYDRTPSKPEPSGHDGPAQSMKTRPEDAISTKRIRNRGSRVVFAASVTISGALGVWSQSGALASDAVEPIDLQSAPRREWAVSVRWENDTFGGTDRFYTDGVALGVSHTGPSWMDPLADWLPWGEGRRTVGYDVAQGMFTPSDTKRSVPDPNDRPYAGILAFGLTLHIEKETSYHGLKFVTGVVGPCSLAKETQDTVHDLIGNGKSQGWDHQLHNEPIFNLAYEYRHKFHLTGQGERWSLEALPLAGGWLGNMLTQGEIGGLLRAGYNMPNDFGPSLVRGMGFMPPPRNTTPGASKSGWGFSVYGGAFGNFVLRDVTLDGNTWQDSPSVDNKFFVPAAGVGMSVGNRRIQASFSFVFWGEEFEGQQDYSKFGSLSISYFF